MNTLPESFPQDPDKQSFSLGRGNSMVAIADTGMKKSVFSRSVAHGEATETLTSNNHTTDGNRVAL